MGDVKSEGRKNKLIKVRAGVKVVLFSHRAPPSPEVPVFVPKRQRVAFEASTSTARERHLPALPPPQRDAGALRVTAEDHD